MRLSILCRLFVVLLLCPVAARAGESAEGPASNPGDLAVRVKADAVRFTVQITTAQDVVDYQFYELAEARRLLAEAVARNGHLSTSTYDASPSFDSRAYKVSSGRGGSGSLTMELSYPIKEGFNFLACGREVNALVRDIKRPEKTRFDYAITSMLLVTNDPESHRPALLKKFAEGVQAMSAALGSKVRYTIQDLAGPIHQRPVGEDQVEVFLNPRVTLQAE